MKDTICRQRVFDAFKTEQLLSAAGSKNNIHHWLLKLCPKQPVMCIGCPAANDEPSEVLAFS